MIIGASHMAKWLIDLPTPVFQEISGPNGYWYLRYYKLNQKPYHAQWIGKR